MHLASISSQEENDRLEKHIKDFGKLLICNWWFMCENRVVWTHFLIQSRWWFAIFFTSQFIFFLYCLGFGNEHFWTSGTDLAEEGNFFWMATGKPITFTNWNAGEPNNFRYENGEEENCLELWNRDGKGLKWNDSPCSFETYFVCEA